MRRREFMLGLLATLAVTPSSVTLVVPDEEMTSQPWRHVTLSWSEERDVEFWVDGVRVASVAGLDIQVVRQSSWGTVSFWCRGDGTSVVIDEASLCRGYSPFDKE